jgi:hypothetical protein
LLLGPAMGKGILVYTWYVRGGGPSYASITLEDSGRSPLPRFLRSQTIRQVGAYLLCSCAFQERFGLPCRHMLLVLQRGPIPTDCAVRWRRDYAAMCYAGNSTIDLAFCAAKAEEPIGPIYEDLTATPPTTYPAFLCGIKKELTYFTDPIRRTMYYFEGSSLIHTVPVYGGKQVPDCILPSHLSLLQRQEEGEYEQDDVGKSLVDTQAYYVLYPKFKQIVSVSDGNSQILGKAMEAMHEMYSIVLAEAAAEEPGNRQKYAEAAVEDNNNTATEDHGVKRFTSSNLPSDVYAKSNKRIRPLGERGYKHKK